jgi:hypothetical protein
MSTLLKLALVAALLIGATVIAVAPPTSQHGTHRDGDLQLRTTASAP